MSCIWYCLFYLSVTSQCSLNKQIVKMPPPPNYTQDELSAAIKAFKKDGLSLREAELLYNVPRDTIRRNNSNNEMAWFGSYLTEFVNI